MAQTTKGRKKARTPGKSGAPRRQERRFPTDTAHFARWIAITGLFAALLLGMGVFGHWILDPSLPWASYLLALGGLGLGVVLWFGQAEETLVAVGDAGIAVEDGRNTTRLPWHAIRTIRIQGDRFSVEGEGKKLSFSVVKNRRAAAEALQEAAERVPQVLDVKKEIAQTLPRTEASAIPLEEVQHDQVAGLRCAASGKLIALEEDARLCARCGQIYEQTQLPERCKSCETELKDHTLRA